MSMMKQCVEEFHKAFDLPLETTFKPISKDLMKLRLDLIEEEVNELILGVLKNDPENIAKELCDIIYVVIGMATVMGIDVDKSFRIVHNSNMSKLGPDYKPVYREDGKVLKGPNFVPADLSEIVKGEKDAIC